MSCRVRGILPHSFEFPGYMPFPCYRAAVDEVRNNIQAPLPLICFSALATLSMTIQGLYDVKKPNGQRVPVSLMLLTIADSGERKTSADNKFSETILAFQREQEAAYQDKLRDWSVKYKIWEAKNKTILRSIEKASATGICSAEQERLLMEHETIKPEMPRKFKIIYKDTTSEALFWGLYKDIPSAAIISTEGGDLNNRALNDLSKQASIWSDDSISIERKTTNSFEVSGARLTLSLMVQKSSFDKYMERRGEVSRGSGIWARYLVCHPESTQGDRFLDNTTVSWEHVDVFSSRLEELLEINTELLDNPKRQRTVVELSPEASERWLDIYNAIEFENKPDGRFEGMGDYASKLAENIIRVAALFHVFEGFEGDISERTLNYALDLCVWSSGEFRRLFVPPAQIELDMRVLDSWLFDEIDAGRSSVRKNDILKYGPNQLRKKSRLDPALEGLYQEKRIAFFTDKHRRRCVDLEPMMRLRY